tara:strand:- start:207 stop:1187 length:981 start_codon:yes stop_codon:yes gene_type:complete
MSHVPVVKNVEEVYKKACDEVSRRAAVAKSHDAEALTYFSQSAQPCPLPFHLPDQDFVLLTMGTSVLAPVPVDPTRPSLRIYGTFASREEAVEHSSLVRRLDPVCSLVVAQRNEWLLMPQSETMRVDLVARQLKVEEKLQTCRLRQQEEGDAFMRAAKEHVERPAPPSSLSSREGEEEEAETEEVERMVYGKPRRLRAGAEVRGQASVALCCMADEHGECLVKVLGCFESHADADGWVQDVGSRHITEDDILITSTCEWIYPNGEAMGQKKYRVDELQRVMDAAERNPEQVRTYKEWKREQDEAKAREAQVAKEESESEERVAEEE